MSLKKNFSSRGSLISTLFILSACSPAQSYLNKGFILAQTGFIAHNADTTARYTMMNTLPPGKLTYRLGPQGQRIYLYADPVACGCVYMGNEGAYQTLTNFINSRKRGSKYKHFAASLDSMTVETRQNTQEWDWSAWSHNADPGSNLPKHIIGGNW